MGGYGVAAVNGVVQGTSAVLAFGTGLMRVFRREGAEEAKVARTEQQPEKRSWCIKKDVRDQVSGISSRRSVARYMSLRLEAALSRW